MPPNQILTLNYNYELLPMQRLRIWLSRTLCPDCGGRMRVLAALTEPGSIRRCLEGMGLSWRSSPVAPARSAAGVRLRRRIHPGIGVPVAAQKALVHCYIRAIWIRAKSFKDEDQLRQPAR